MSVCLEEPATNLKGRKRLQRHSYLYSGMGKPCRLHTKDFEDLAGMELGMGHSRILGAELA